MIEVNQYFDDNVKSLAFSNNEGNVTCGVMDIGEYHFTTSQHELMKVISGQLDIKLVGSDHFVSYPSGTEFKVAANSAFDVIVLQQTAYLCFYS